jgi:hypothetical protein
VGSDLAETAGPPRMASNMTVVASVTPGDPISSCRPSRRPAAWAANEDLVERGARERVSIVCSETHPAGRHRKADHR